jgi:hypothetical protein
MDVYRADDIADNDIQGRRYREGGGGGGRV